MSDDEVFGYIIDRTDWINPWRNTAIVIHAPHKDDPGAPACNSHLALSDDGWDARDYHEARCQRPGCRARFRELLGATSD